MTTDQKNPITVTFKIQHDGFGADLTAECLIEHIPGIVAKLREQGVTPANSPYVWEGQPSDRTNGAGSGSSDAPICPVHGTPMRQSTKHSGWYCSRKIVDGSYCKERAVA